MKTIALEGTMKGFWEAQNRGKHLRELDPEDWSYFTVCPACGRTIGEKLTEETCDLTCQDGSGWTVFEIM